jgi:AbiV family abortive infection protein
MKKEKNYNLTPEFLHAYQKGALKNSGLLLDEAILLQSNHHYARAYFLALASIEEAGKAYQSFQAQGRNLRNGGVCKAIKENFENHNSKITAAFIGWISLSNNPEEALKASIDLTLHLKHGREKSMYVDVKENGVDLSIPAEVVRPVAARDCIRLAQKCLYYTKHYTESTTPFQCNQASDKLLCLRQKDLLHIFNEKDFWKFCLNEIKKGSAWEKATVDYYDQYFMKKKKFMCQDE